MKASKGSGGRPLSFLYLLQTKTDINLLTSDQLTKFNTLKAILLQENAEKISFAASMIDAGIEYKLLVATTNFLATQTSAEKIFQKVVDTVPAVRLPSRKVIKGYKRNYLKGKKTGVFSPCLGLSNVLIEGNKTSFKTVSDM